MGVLLAVVLLVLSAPLWVMVILLMIILQGFPVFFIQARVGKGMKQFRIVKFRTMKQQKITPLGRILRNIGVDEWPQLLNIIKGDMAFVGPRPLTVSDVKRLGWDTPYHEKRWDVKPGISGLAQLSPVCHRKVTWYYDSYYSKHKSVKLNMYIVWQTALIMIIGKSKLKQHKRKKYKVTTFGE